MTLIELSLAGLLVGLLTLTAWPAVRGAALRMILSADAARLESALRHGRDLALLESRVVSLNAVSASGRLAPSTPTVRFYPDGTADPFNASAARGGAVIEVSMDATGRIQVTHAPA